MDFLFLFSINLQREEEERRRKIEEWENHKLGRGYHNKTKSTVCVSLQISILSLICLY